MKTSKIALIIYFNCCAFAIISYVFRLEGLMLFTIPLIIPALFFYYFAEIKKIKIIICLFLLSNFFLNALVLMDFENELYYMIPSFFVSNLLIIIVMIKNLEKFKLNFLNITSLIIIGAFLSYILLIFLEIFSIEESNLKILVAIFGSQLLILPLLASFNIIWKINISNLFLMMCASCILVSDIFYVIFNFQNQLLVIDTIYFSCQLFSYFFFIKYVLVREQNKKNHLKYE